MDSDKLFQRTNHFRGVARAAWQVRNWQVQLSALQELVDLAPKLWPMMRSENFLPVGEEAIPELLNAYEVLLDRNRLVRLSEIVSSVPELKLLYAPAITRTIENLPHVRQIYDKIKAEPGIIQSSLDESELLYLAAVYGIVKREKQGRSYALTFIHLPIFEFVPMPPQMPAASTSPPPLSYTIGPGPERGLDFSVSLGAGLSDEDKRRIEAEEAYRAEIRRRANLPRSAQVGPKQGKSSCMSIGCATLFVLFAFSLLITNLITTPATKSGEPVIVQRSNGSDGVELDSFNWTKSGPVAMARFVVRNTNTYPVKDIAIGCTFSGESDTQISSVDKTLYVTIPAGKSKSVTGLNLGLISDQVSKANCRVRFTMRAE